MYGAKIMIDEGVLDAAGDRVVGAYALHAFSTVLPQGIAVTPPQPVTAIVCTPALGRSATCTGTAACRGSRRRPGPSCSPLGWCSC
ncbi:hypothetical protein [Actinomadura sp. KC345]|uniref:hypothetical protein n=1 Tax=Actinomadura sp. KC345 TaxID=2530371 RepID=UPI001A9CCF07|nr:hypothetical protein [Actinomadura sp. KC345]